PSDRDYNDYRCVVASKRIAFSKPAETGSGGRRNPYVGSRTVFLPIHGRSGTGVAALGVVVPPGLLPGFVGILTGSNAGNLRGTSLLFWSPCCLRIGGLWSVCWSPASILQGIH